MKNLIIRTISAIVIAIAMLEATASENGWYYILWGVIGIGGIVELLTLQAKHPTPNRQRWTIGGVAYIALATTIVMLLQAQWQLVIVLITTVWANDVGAYLVGIAIGRHKMAPTISPKKSWEGFIGGLIFGISAAIAWWIFYFGPAQALEIGVEHPSNTLIWAGLGLVTALAAVGGDLLESKFKRTIGVKDSGKIIPGHGGILDRFDALYLAIPLFYIYCILLNLI